MGQMAMGGKDLRHDGSGFLSFFFFLFGVWQAIWLLLTFYRFKGLIWLVDW